MDSSKVQLNQEQLHHLFNKLSSDEQKELQDILKNCTSEVTLTRGVPVAALTLGSVYFARSRLPAAYQFGPKGWPFYAILGIASFTVTNVLSMGMCRERVNPKIQELWVKYGENQSATNYASLRERNRIGTQATPSMSSESSPYPSSSYSTHQEQKDSTYDDTYAPRVRRRPLYDEQPEHLLSGTPSGPRSTTTKSTYGDEGFS